MPMHTTDTTITVLTIENGRVTTKVLQKHQVLGVTRQTVDEHEQCETQLIGARDEVVVDPIDWNKIFRRPVDTSLANDIVPVSFASVMPDVPPTTTVSVSADSAMSDVSPATLVVQPEPSTSAAAKGIVCGWEDDGSAVSVFYFIGGHFVCCLVCWMKYCVRSTKAKLTCRWNGASKIIMTSETLNLTKMEMKLWSYVTVCGMWIEA